MLKKMFKTILVLSLCIGVVLPTNAAVSVSDGSAFVTKAEFAADLNNLSNRMAQLENSLDAKIDSLVSSYLTRNGIWNGARVDINYGITELKNSNFISVFYNGDTNKVVWTENATIEKTGMAFVSVKIGFTYESSDYAVSRPHLRYAGGCWNGVDTQTTLYLRINETTGTNTEVRSSTVLSSGVQTAQTTNFNPQTQGRIYMQLPAATFTLLAFVSKGNTIGVQIYQTANAHILDGYDVHMETALGFPDSSTSRMNVNIETCSIY